MLEGVARVRVVPSWPDASAGADDAMLALHARRSSASIHAWHARHGSRGLGVVLTGTDLYRDIREDTAAQASIEMAARLVVLQERGAAALPARLRPKARVIFQSSTPMEPLPKRSDMLSAVMVGHLREVKSPGTLMDAARTLGPRTDVLVEHIGEAIEPGWADAARATEAATSVYRWLGALPHEQTRERIRAAHVLVHASAMEGGAHVIMEAVRSGTPVIASHVDGNVGMLGENYEGYFEPGDAGELAALLARCRQGQVVPDGGILSRLRAQCDARAPLFAPEAEQAALIRLIHELQEPA